jgi:putative tryptophan/tyrosine transport system substrate-binding protein
MMDRRTFVGRVAGGLLAAPLAARAQQPKMPIIGFLGTSSYSAQSAYAVAFAQRLRELGWIEGRTVAIEYRWGDGRNDRLSEVVAEFVRLKVDVIVTGGNAVLAAKQATATIPIVFGLAADPVGTGMVASLSRPGGNVTGMSLQSSDLAGKRLGLCREVLPGLRRIAILANAGYPAAMLEMGQAEAAARILRIEAVKLEVRNANDIAPAIAGFKGGDLLYVCTDAFVGTNVVEINNLALAARLPTMHGSTSYLKTGGLMAYGPNVPAMFRRAAELVDKILKGAKPADLPVEQPSAFELGVNLKTAKTLGLTIPQSILLRADEVIQ